MRRGVIRIGDPLSSGGQVASACSNFKVDGKEVAGVGDACHCNRHGDVQIVEGIETFTFFGKKLALHGCKVSCGCSVLSTTELMVVDTGGGGAAQESQAEPPQPTSVETKYAMTLAEKETKAGEPGSGSKSGKSEQSTLITIIDATKGDYLLTNKGPGQPYARLQQIIAENNIKVISVSNEVELREASSSAKSKGTTILIIHTYGDPRNINGSPLGIEIGSFYGQRILTNINSSNPLVISGKNLIVVGCGAEDEDTRKFFSFSAQRAYGISARIENGGLINGTYSAIHSAYQYLSKNKPIPPGKMFYEYDGRTILFGSWTQ